MTDALLHLPTIGVAVDAAEQERWDDLDAWLAEARQDPLYAWWERWYNLTPVRRAGERRIATALNRARRRRERRGSK